MKQKLIDEIQKEYDLYLNKLQQEKAYGSQDFLGLFLRRLVAEISQVKTPVRKQQLLKFGVKPLIDLLEKNREKKIQQKLILKYISL